MTKARINGAEVKVNMDKEYAIRLTGRHIAMLIEMIRKAHFVGDQAFLVVDLIDAIQTPVLNEAHGAVAEPTVQAEAAPV